MDGAQALTQAARRRGDLYLQPLRVVSEQEAAPEGVPLDVRAGNVLSNDGADLDVHLVWTARQPFTNNYNVSLRLLDDQGVWLSQHDGQPGYGFLPSSGWPLGMEVDDWLAMSMPVDPPQEIPLPLVLRLYEVESGTEVLSRKLGDVVINGGQLRFRQHQPDFDLPARLQPLSINFGDGIKLHGYEITKDGSDLSLTLYWEALASGQPDYTRFIHIFDPQSGEIIMQSDGRPRNDSYPTSQWISGEIVTDTTRFDLSETVPGAYQIGLGFYRQEVDSLLHLTAVNLETQETYPANRALIPEPVVWP
jgi:hypothetical protein